MIPRILIFAKTFISSKILKKGNFDAKINLNFDDKGKIKDDYEIWGKADQVTLSLLNKNSIFYVT